MVRASAWCGGTTSVLVRRFGTTLPIYCGMTLPVLFRPGVRTYRCADLCGCEGEPTLKQSRASTRGARSAWNAPQKRVRAIVGYEIATSLPHVGVDASWYTSQGCWDGRSSPLAHSFERVRRFVSVRTQQTERFLRGRWLSRREDSPQVDCARAVRFDGPAAAAASTDLNVCPSCCSLRRVTYDLPLSSLRLGNLPRESVGRFYYVQASCSA